MKSIEFYTRVGQRLHCSQEEAIPITQAVFSTLGEVMDWSQQQLLAAQLPIELKTPILEHKDKQLFGLEEFYRRVAGRAGYRYSQAVHVAQAVIMVLQEAVSKGQIDEVLAQLPLEYEELFGRRPTTPLSPTVEHLGVSA